MPTKTIEPLKTQTILTDFSYPSNVLSVFFAGMDLRKNSYNFEFVKATAQIPIHKIFLRDAYNLWYHKGLPGLSSNIDETASFLSRYTQNPKYKKVVLVGNSMGGYAAILFGILLSVNEVIAFCPKTYISPPMRFFTFDWFSWRQTWKLFWQIRVQRKYFNLRKIIKKNTKTQCHVYFSASSRIDKLHISQLKTCKLVTYYPYNFSKHTLIKHLNTTHELQNILAKHLN